MGISVTSVTSVIFVPNKGQRSGLTTNRPGLDGSVVDKYQCRTSGCIGAAAAGVDLGDLTASKAVVGLAPSEQFLTEYMHFMPILIDINRGVR